MQQIVIFKLIYNLFNNTKYSITWNSKLIPETLFPL